MENIVFLDQGAMRGAQLRKPTFEHEWKNYNFSHTDDESTVQERLKDATIAITNRTHITENIVKACPRLKLVAVAATGYDVVDVRACSTLGITVCNVQDWAISVPEHVFALALALRRQLLQYRAAVAAGDWARTSGTSFVLSPTPEALAGSTLGLVGYGALAKRVERLARAFDMAVLIAERRGAVAVRDGRTSYERTLRESDVLVLLCPLTSDTRGLVGADELAEMKESAILVNCARGGIVDEAALADALRRGLIAGAGVDVLDEEPPVNGSPLLELELPNLIVTSHMAFASTASIREMVDQLVGNLEAFVRGAPRNVVSS